MAHCPIRGRAPDLGTVATVDHHGGRAGTPGATHPVAGRWVLPSRHGSGSLVCNEPSSASGPSGFSPRGWMASRTPLAAVPRALAPPAVAIHLVRLACARPEALGRSRSPGDGTALAHQRRAARVV